MSGRGRGRLPSFMGKRDLTLGAGKKVGGAAALPGLNKAAGATSDKKKFVPNLNVQRKVKTEPEAATSGPSQPKSGWRNPAAAVPYSASNASAPADGKKVGFKPRQELIQTMDAVFGEGISSDGIRRKKYGGGGGGDGREGGGSSNSLERPKLNMNLKIDKEAEAERLKALLKDDFIDDLSSGPLVPVQLPMVDTGTLFKKEKEEEAEEEIKNVKKKSKRILDSDDDEDEEDAKKEVKKPSVIADSKSDVPKGQLTFPDLVKAQKGDLFFIQLPDHLPGPSKAPPPTKSEREGQMETEGATASIASELEKCTLADLTEGYLGKIQIRKSGRTQLVMGAGSNHMNIDLGTQVGFLQDLVAVNIPPQPEEGSQESSQETPDMTVIGHIKHRLVVAPDWSKLFGGIDAQPPSSDEDETL